MPTPRDPRFGKDPDDPHGTIRKAVRRYASLDHALTPQMIVSPVADRTTSYPGPRQERPTIKNTKREQEDQA